MTLRKGSKISRGYATILDEEGVNYRDIADTMTEMGYPMNHSSARNYVLRIMKKFATAIASEYNISVDHRMEDVIKSPGFQHGIADLLHEVEFKRRKNIPRTKK